MPGRSQRVSCPGLASRNVIEVANPLDLKRDMPSALNGPQIAARVRDLRRQVSEEVSEDQLFLSVTIGIGKANLLVLAKRIRLRHPSEILKGSGGKLAILLVRNAHHDHLFMNSSVSPPAPNVDIQP